MKIIVSACLLGSDCKYNGKNNLNDRVIRFVAGHEVTALCPEVMAGLGIPRKCAEIRDGKMVDSDGRDMNFVYHLGVQRAIDLIERESPDLIILQSRSPTCGVRQIYDGHFTGTLISGQGFLARELIRRGYSVMDAGDV